MSFYLKMTKIILHKYYNLLILLASLEVSLVVYLVLQGMVALEVLLVVYFLVYSIIPLTIKF